MKMMKKIAACFVTVAVASVSVAAMGMQASATDEPPYTAYLCASIGGVAQWSAGEWETKTATITADAATAPRLSFQILARKRSIF
ncbi:MAG: hypothetical protein LUC50_01440 [Ruminococcus sp.]|nr:hypothetical protein [Ruminococcus sp.]